MNNKSAPGSDGEPRPDVLWPNSQEILCSAVSACTRFIVLGLVSQLVTIWDRRFGKIASLFSLCKSCANLMGFSGTVGSNLV